MWSHLIKFLYRTACGDFGLLVLVLGDSMFGTRTLDRYEDGVLERCKLQNGWGL
jgi:hypothetical protein